MTNVFDIASARQQQITDGSFPFSREQTTEYWRGIKKVLKQKVKGYSVVPTKHSPSESVNPTTQESDDEQKQMELSFFLDVENKDLQ